MRSVAPDADECFVDKECSAWLDDTESLETPLLIMTERELLVSKDRLKLMPGFLS